MVLLIFFAICFCASVIGAICGIGGGVIIKPVLDAFHIMDVSVISFLSGCTVLSMTAYSVVKSKMSKESHIDRKIGVPLAAGAAFGGLAGKWMFSRAAALSPDPGRVGALQAACLLAVTLGTLAYTICKAKITTKHVENPAVCVLIGLFLGILSSFLGIGGGPINLVVLFFFFSRTTKAAAEKSRCIIQFSQIASLVSSIVTKTIPDFEIPMLVLMASGGILGGITGRSLNKKISDRRVDQLFLSFMVVIILINIYNIYIYLG